VCVNKKRDYTQADRYTMSKSLKSKGSKANTKAAADKKNAKGQPSLDEFIQNRDYTGALTLLEFRLKCQDGDSKDLLLWIGYCAFHTGNYKRAEEVYHELINSYDVSKLVHLYIACCYFNQQMFEEAEKEAERAPDDPLRNRLLFHIAHRTTDENKLMSFHQKLRDIKEDLLSLASVHYLRSHYQEATDIYKRLLLENRDDLALNVYVAMCYYKLDYYDVSLEILAVYLQSFPDSPLGINLKACNHFRLYNGKAAEAELKVLTDKGVNVQGNDLIRHNLVVFSNGDQALQVLPQLMESVPEARLNLVSLYLISVSVSVSLPFSTHNLVGVCADHPLHATWKHPRSLRTRPRDRTSDPTGVHHQGSGPRHHRTEHWQSRAPQDGPAVFPTRRNFST
jgi:intraflagellar transport protein 56